MHNTSIKTSRIHQIASILLLCTALLCTSCSDSKREDPYVTYFTQLLQVMYNFQADSAFLDYTKIKKLSGENFLIFCSEMYSNGTDCDVRSEQAQKKKPDIQIKQTKEGKPWIYLNGEPLAWDIYWANPETMYQLNHLIQEDDLLIRAKYYGGMYDMLKKIVPPNEVISSTHLLLLNYFKYSYEQFKAFYTGLSTHNIAGVVMSPKGMAWKFKRGDRGYVDYYFKYQRMAQESWDEYHRKIQVDVLQNELRKMFYLTLFPWESVTLEKVN